MIHAHTLIPLASLSFLFFFSLSSFFLVRRNERLMMKAWLGRDAKGVGLKKTSQRDGVSCASEKFRRAGRG